MSLPRRSVLKAPAISSPCRRAYVKRQSYLQKPEGHNEAGGWRSHVQHANIPRTKQWDLYVVCNTPPPTTGWVDSAAGGVFSRQPCAVVVVVCCCMALVVLLLALVLFWRCPQVENLAEMLSPPKTTRLLQLKYDTPCLPQANINVYKRKSDEHTVQHIVPEADKPPADERNLSIPKRSSNSSSRLPSMQFMFRLAVPSFGGGGRIKAASPSVLCIFGSPCFLRFFLFWVLRWGVDS